MDVRFIGTGEARIKELHTKGLLCHVGGRNDCPYRTEIGYREYVVCGCACHTQDDNK